MKFLFFLLFVRPIWGLIAMSVASNRGMKGGFWWGFFLGVIGIIVVAVRPNEPDNSLQVQYCAECDKVFCIKGAKCRYCGKPLLKTTISSREWMRLPIVEKDNLQEAFSKGQYIQKETEKTQNPTVHSNNPSVISVVDELKKLKELLDDGIISQEEFDAKKKQLLGL